MVWTTIYDQEENFQIPGRCVPTQQLEAVTATSMLDHLCALDIGSRAPVVRLSGIICIIGFACRESDVIEKMIESGMNIACLNFSHGSHEYHTQVLQNIKQAVNNYNKRIEMSCPLAVALMTRGPVIRTDFPLGDGCLEIDLCNGDIVYLIGDTEYVFEKKNLHVVYVNYENIHKVIQIGNHINIDNKRISLVCTDINENIIICKVLKGGIVRTRRRVYLPGVSVDLPTLSKQDKADLLFAVEQGVDIIFAAYIRNGAAVNEIRNFLGPDGKNILIISQIENQQGLSNMDEIIKESDGVIVSRGDLGNEMSEEAVFLAQKAVIAKCNKFGKPVICTTHMLDSMMKKSRPTCAECCDVANAILDGADCILLCNETAKGDYPIECIQKTASICKQAEAAVWQTQLVIDLSDKITPPVIAAQALSSAAVQISLQLLASAIIVVTSTIKAAELLTKYRPKCPVIAITRNVQAARQAHLFRGILPLQYKTERAMDWFKDVQLRVYYGINFGRKRGFIRPGDPVVVMTSSKQGTGFTDRMTIKYVTKRISHGTECIC